MLRIWLMYLECFGDSFSDGSIRLKISSFPWCCLRGQEAELTGYFVYCTQILAWLPPLVFATMIEAGVKQTWGLMSLIIFFAIAIGFLCLVAPWSEVLEESAKPIDDSH